MLVPNKIQRQSLQEIRLSVARQVVNDHFVLPLKIFSDNICVAARLSIKVNSGRA